MKKNVLALSITAALFGLTGGAQAMTGVLGGAAVGSSLALNGDGVGHSLVIPYFTTQDNNSTKINLVNTDQTNGKAVKVRFRGAANSDDIFDFQVFLSPGDVWTASIGKAASGLSQLTTTDASCTKPAASVLNSTAFVTGRLDPAMTAAQLANGTREGYVEIFNMGDIPPLAANTASTPVFDLAGATTAGVTAAPATANPLYTAIKHVSSVAPCSGAAWTALDTTDLIYSTAASVPSLLANVGLDSAAASSPRTFGLLPPTTGLMANWTIINTVGAAAWSGEAFAVQSVVAGVAGTGNVVYWPQTATAATTPHFYTADPLLRSMHVYSNQTTGNTTYVQDATPPVTAGNYDLPDVSTPYSEVPNLIVYTGATTAGTTPVLVSGAGGVVTGPLVQARTMTAALAATAATNEFLTDTAITASTDWVFSMPTRRYNVALDYAANTAAPTTDNGKRFTDINNTLLNAAGPGTLTNGYFMASNTTTVTDTSAAGTNGNGRQICVTGISTKVYDREENTLTGSTAVVVSPSTPAAPLSFCGEAAVLSFNNGGIVATGTGALKASVAVKDLDVTYRNGWMRIATPAATATPGGGGTIQGLPVVGSEFARAFAGTNSFGAAYKHRFTR